MCVCHAGIKSGGWSRILTGGEIPQERDGPDLQSRASLLSVVQTRGRTVPSDDSHICSASPTRNKCVIISAMFNKVYISKQGGAGVWSDACSSDRANSSMLTINASVHMLMLT